MKIQLEELCAKKRKETGELWDSHIFIAKKAFPEEPIIKSKQRVQGIFRGKFQKLSIHDMERLCKTLSCTAGELIQIIKSDK